MSRSINIVNVITRKRKTKTSTLLILLLRSIKSKLCQHLHRNCLYLHITAILCWASVHSHTSISDNESDKGEYPHIFEKSHRDNWPVFTGHYYETDLVEKLRTVRVIAHIDNSQLPAIAIFGRIASAKNRGPYYMY